MRAPQRYAPYILALVSLIMLICMLERALQLNANIFNRLYQQTTHLSQTSYLATDITTIQGDDQGTSVCEFSNKSISVLQLVISFFSFCVVVNILAWLTRLFKSHGLIWRLNHPLHHSPLARIHLRLCIFRE